MSAQPRVVSLHTYPVKSLLGEDLESLHLDARGCVGDRCWSVRTASGKIASGKSTRRFEAVAGLLELRARRSGDAVLVTFPDGSVRAAGDPDADGALSAVIGQPLTFALESDVSHFDDGPVSILGTASVAAVATELGKLVHPSRFRPNVVLDTGQPFVEEQWVGRQVRLGTALLRITAASPRCVMVNNQTADLPALPGHLFAIGKVNYGNLGVVATVVTPGSVAPGAAVEVL